jgi:drug/metabolite transporter (DMT)-like permease
MIGGAIPLLIASTPALIGTDWGKVNLGGWLALFYSSVISMGVAYFFWYRGLRVLGPTRAAVYTQLQPIVALIVAWIFLHETPTVFQGVGAATIVGGVFLARA